MSYSFLPSINDWSVKAHVLDLPLWTRIGVAVDTAKANMDSVASVALYTETDLVEARRIATYINETRRHSIDATVTQGDGAHDLLVLKLL